MTSTQQHRAVIVLVAIALISSCSLLVLGGTNSPSDALVLALPATVTTGYALVGAVILRRRPGHVIGWLFLGLAAYFGPGVFSEELVRSNPRIAGATWLAWIGAWHWTLIFFVLVVLLPLLFPTGRLPSRRWTWVLWTGAAGWTILVVSLMLAPGELSVDGFENPIGWAPMGSLTTVLVPAGMSLVAVACAASVISLVVRFRMADATGRLQIKWFVVGVMLAVVGISINITLGFAFDNLEAALPAFGVGALGPPVAAGIAIVRFRLYEIDRVVARTISYAVVIAFLASVYALGAVWLPTLLAGSQSSIFVAASTLLVAALFNPVRKRVQTQVERRFNRTRYEAERVIGEFSGSLRAQADPQGILDGWLGVVDQTMQPSAAGVWLRSS